MKNLLPLFLCLALAGGCNPESGEADGPRLPEGKTLLADSAGAMATVTAVAFKLEVDGALSVFQVQTATGHLRSDGRAKATAVLKQGDRLVEYEYVLVANQAYLKGPTGGFQPIPATVEALFFNPTALLSGEKSLSSGLAQSTNARTEAEEEVEGVGTFRVTATVNPSRIEGLSLLASGSSQEARLWIAQDTNYLIKAVMPFKVSGREEETVVSVTFSDFNKEVEITAPA